MPIEFLGAAWGALFLLTFGALFYHSSPCVTNHIRKLFKRG